MLDSEENRSIDIASIALKKSVNATDFVVNEALESKTSIAGNTAAAKDAIDNTVRVLFDFSEHILFNILSRFVCSQMMRPH